jgi:hypothetical protein
MPQIPISMSLLPSVALVSLSARFGLPGLRSSAFQLFGGGSPLTVDRDSLSINRFFKQTISSPSDAKLTS